MKKSRLCVVLAVLVFFTGCSNVLEGMSGKTSDEALYEDALKYLNDQKYTASVAKFNALSSGFASRTAVKENWAGALAGQCGLNFINYFNSLSSVSLTGSTFFKYLMAVWAGKAVAPASCSLAEAKIKEIWVTDTPTASQQLFMAMLSMVKIGTYLASKADLNSDGTPDAGFNACTNNAANLTDAEVKEIVTGFSLFLQNIVGFTASLSGSLTGSVTAISTLCSALTPNPCATSETANVTAGMVDSFRDILKSPDPGMDANPCMVISNACCP